MALKKIRQDLRNYFLTGLRPTANNFADLIESNVNILDDKATDADITLGTSDEKFVTVLGSKKLAQKNITVNGNSANQTTGDIQITTITGNAGTATKLETSRTINGVAFDGSTNIAITTITGNSGTATKLETSRNINGIAFNGSADIFTQKIYSLTADKSVSTARGNVSELAFSVVSGKKYKIEIIGDYKTAVTGTNGSLGFIMTSGAAIITGYATMEINASINNLGLKTSITIVPTVGSPYISNIQNSFITSSGAATNVTLNLYANLILECTADGIFQVQWGSSNFNAATLNKATNMIVTQLN